MVPTLTAPTASRDRMVAAGKTTAILSHGTRFHTEVTVESESKILYWGLGRKL